MALNGNITFDAYGQTISLNGKYMRLSRLSVINYWQNVSTTQPVGEDGMEVSPQQILTHVSEVSGTLDVHNLSTDPMNGIAPIASQSYQCPYDPSVTNATVQLYDYVMSQIPGSVKS